MMCGAAFTQMFGLLADGIEDEGAADVVDLRPGASSKESSETR